MFQRIRQLFGHFVVYGAGDAATQILSFLLLPLYVRYLSPADYGVLAQLLAIEVLAKIAFRWGIDAAFMRLYYDCPDRASRQRLASTQFLFLAATSGALLLVALLAAPALGRHLFSTEQYTTPLRLVLVNTFVVGFYYLPFHVMRIEGRPGQFITLTFIRSAATLVARLVLVIGFTLGVLGVVLADVVVTVGFTLVLLRWFVPLLRPTFSRQVLVDSLRFGLPRVPHGVAHQVVAVADRYLLGRFVTLHEVGLYSTGATFGLGLKLFLSAFETAWAPFYFGAMREPDAKATFSRVTTYGLAVLVLLWAGLSATASDLVALMTTSSFHHAARVVPWVALGVTLQGLYLLTSIGLNITRRTEYYPVATIISAATSIVANLALIPRLGITGAAMANALAYAVLAFVAYHFSQRVYPIRYETGRLARVVVAGLASFVVARYAIPDMPALAGLIARGGAVVGVYVLVLAASGFFVEGEVERLSALARRLRRHRVVEEPAEVAEMAGEFVAAPTTDRAEDAGEETRR